MSGLFILVVAPFFFVGGPDATSSLFLKNIWNFGHILFFALLLLLIQAFKPFVHWQQWLLVTIGAIVVGGVIEFAQHFVGRNSSLDDVVHNVFGVWLGLFWGQKSTRLISLLRFMSACLIAPALWLVIDSGSADLVMRKQFPQLNSFESRYELQQLRANNRQVKISHTQQFSAHGKSAAHIMLTTDTYAGVSLTTSFGDWGSYAALSMDIYNPDSEPLVLVVKISDYAHDRGENNVNDRFNRRIMLMKGWNQVQIDLNDVRIAPEKRAMKMNEISSITIFAAQLAVKRSFYLDNIRLHN